MPARISPSFGRRARPRPASATTAAAETARSFMPMFNSTRRVRHSPEQMFALVADVEKYPQFLPLCEDLQIRRRTAREGGGEVLVADMSVGYKAIRETFTSRVTLDPSSLKILVEYVDGPFRYLENRWTFRPHPDGCEVSFFISYEFASRMLGLL